MSETRDVWKGIAAPLPAGVVQWRQQGKPKARDGKFYAPFVAYIDAQFVRDRLDAAVPGEWDLTLELLPPAVTGEGEEMEPFSFKARLSILGVIRESVGSGKDYKTAETDAFKRAGVRFGIGAELYTDYEIVWVQVESDSKYAKPVEDPATVYARKSGKPLARPQVEKALDMAPATEKVHAMSDSLALTDADDYACPKCHGKMWDNRTTKRNPKAPDFKCRDRSCDGVIWPPKGENVAAAKTPAAQEQEHEWEEIPF